MRRLEWPIELAIINLVFAHSVCAAPVDEEKKTASCKAQATLAALYAKYRREGESKESQLKTNAKLTKDQPAALGKMYASLIEAVYAAKMDELDLVPGLVYSTCMHGPQ